LLAHGAYFPEIGKIRPSAGKFPRLSRPAGARAALYQIGNPSAGRNSISSRGHSDTPLQGIIEVDRYLHHCHTSS
jgi:hypothetical protein